MSLLIAQEKTIKAAIYAAKNRNMYGRITPDLESIKILEKVLRTGEADMETIAKYKKVN